MLNLQPMQLAPMKVVGYTGAILLLASSPFSYAEDNGFYGGLRVGLYEGYKKDVMSGDQNLKGTFEGNNLGIVAGYQADNWRYFVNYNPSGSAEIDSKNEEANVESFLAGVDYRFWQQGKHNLSAGAFVSYLEFELEKGPGGISFQDNPTADGANYGLLAHYRYDLTDNWQVGAGLTLGLGEIDGKGTGLSGGPIDIKVTEYQQFDLTINYLF